MPAENLAAMAKVHPLLTKEQVEQILHGEAVKEDNWIQDKNQRKQLYRELIVSGDRTALMGMVATLHRHKRAQLAAGRKFHLCDENFLRDAQKLLTGELSLVLGISPAEVADYVSNVVET